MISVMILELHILAHAAVQPELSQGLAGVQDIMAILQSKVTVERERCQPFEGVSYIIQGLVNVDLDGLPLVVARDSNVDNALRLLEHGPVWKSTSESGCTFGDDAAMSTESSGVRLTPPRRRADVASTA